MDDKTLKLSVLGLAIVAVGSVVVSRMGFPAGLFITLPVGIPHAFQIYRWFRQ